MESELFSVEDELFLFETFLKLSSQDYNDEAEVFISEDESDESLDVPLLDFFMYEKEPEQCPSPVDTIPSPTPPQQFFPQHYPRSPSPCESPTSLFPPIHLENILPPCTPTPSVISTPPSTPLPQQSPSFPPPEYKIEPIPEPTYTPPTADAESAGVHFIDLKDLYEKAQVRRKGTSEQRLVDCRIHMVANFLTVPCNVQVWVQRFAEIKGFQNTVELPVTIEKILPNMQYFSVNLDAVYMTSLGNKFYQLSTTDRFRKNRFVIHVNLMFEDNSIAQFKSEPFLIRSRKLSPNPRKPRSYSD
ncbi:Hypothetical predicted protein [Paramuricea clavata]|nr:Hypothetical predicted protein [Paramuricea clavata]